MWINSILNKGLCSRVGSFECQFILSHWMCELFRELLFEATQICDWIFADLRFVISLQMKFLQSCEMSSEHIFSCLTSLVRLRCQNLVWKETTKRGALHNLEWIQGNDFEGVCCTKFGSVPPWQLFELRLHYWWSPLTQFTLEVSCKHPKTQWQSLIKSNLTHSQKCHKSNRPSSLHG